MLVLGVMFALADDGSLDRCAWTFNCVSGSLSRGYRLATGRWILALGLLLVSPIHCVEATGWRRVVGQSRLDFCWSLI